MIYSKIILPGNPTPLARPRFSTKIGKAYNSQAKLMQHLSFLVAQQWSKFGYSVLNGSILCRTTFFMPIPKSLSKKKKDLLNGRYHDHRPDTDNLVKMILDVITLAGCCWNDDAQVAVINATKIYSNKPKTEISLVSLGENL